MVWTPINGHTLVPCLFLFMIHYSSSLSYPCFFPKLLQVWKHTIFEIQSTFPSCSKLNYIVESNSRMLNTIYDAAATLQQQNQESLSASLIIDLSPSSNSNSPPILFIIQNRYFFKHHQPCSIIFYELNEFLTNNPDRLNNGTIGRRWPEMALPLLPNNIQTSFFVFFTSSASDEDHRSTANDVMHQTRMILHAVFILPGPTGNIEVLKGLPRTAHGDLQAVAALDSEGFETVQNNMMFYRMYTDFYGEPLITLFCLVCLPDDEIYKKSSTARGGFHLVWYEIYKKFNLTREVEEVFGVPTMGVKLEEDENGKEKVSEYDDFLIPVVEGTAAISSIVITNPYVGDVVWLTRPHVYDAMCFITAPPKLHSMQSVAVLQDPLKTLVWLGIGISFSAVVVPLVIILNCFRGRHHPLHALAIVLRPVIDQSSELCHKMQSLSGKLLIGSWLLAMIVLGSGYKSELTSAIVVRRYIYPPRTFAELAASDYAFDAVFFQSVEHDLRAFNTSVNHALVSRVGERNFMDPDCYQMIFEGKKACIGYMISFDLVGLKFMVDVNGRPMYLRSKDEHFNGQAMAAISKFYPMLYEPMEYMLSLVEQSGISNSMKDNEKRELMKAGRIYANRNVDTYDFYKGFDHHDESDDDKVVGVVLEILRFGFGTAVSVFLLEIISKWILRLVEDCMANPRAKIYKYPWNRIHTPHSSELFIPVQPLPMW